MNPKKLTVQVQPGSKKNEVVGLIDGVLKVKIKAPPVDGKANAELIKFIAKALGVRKSLIRIIAGEKSKKKVLEIDGIEEAYVEAKLFQKQQ